MEQVMAPKWNFKTKRDEEDVEDGSNRTLSVKGLTKATPRAESIIDNDMTELKAEILASDVLKQAMSNSIIAEEITQVMIPKIIRERYPALTEEEVEQVRQQVVLSSAIQGADVEVRSNGQRFIKVAGHFVEISKLSINLIDSINPFQRAYEMLSKSITPEVLRTVQFAIEEQRTDMTKEEAILLIKKYLPKYREEHNGAVPALNDAEPLNRRIAQAIAYISNMIRKGEIKKD
jgi:hypothetical protein